MTPQDTIRRFEKYHVTTACRYIGPDWRKLFYGSDWPYAYGEYIPVDKRYSAALSYNYHAEAWRLQGTEARYIGNHHHNPELNRLSQGAQLRYIANS